MEKQQKSDKKPKKSEEYQEKPGGKFKEGNPGGGRPEGTFSLLSLLKAELQKIPKEYKEDKKTYADLIIKRMLADAIKKGDQQQIKLIWNYLEGMPRQGFDFSGNPLLVKVIRNGGEDN